MSQNKHKEFRDVYFVKNALLVIYLYHLPVVKTAKQQHVVIGTHKRVVGKTVFFTRAEAFEAKHAHLLTYVKADAVPRLVHLVINAKAQLREFAQSGTFKIRDLRLEDKDNPHD